MYEITARYPDRCRETGKIIRQGDRCLYAGGKIFHIDSQIAKVWRSERSQAGAIELERNSYGRRAV